MNVILVATDGSEGGTAAVREAATMAAREAADLVVLTVMPRLRRASTSHEELTEYARIEHLGGDEAEAAALVADDILAEAKETIAGQDCAKVSYISRFGDPANEILACARACSASHVVLGSRGHGPLGAFLLGSVSRQVANAAPCAVKIVPRC